MLAKIICKTSFSEIYDSESFCAPFYALAFMQNFSLPSQTKKARPPPFKFYASRYFELTLRPKSEQDKRDQHPQVAPEAFHCQTKHWVMRPAVRHKKERRDFLVFLFNRSVFSSSQCDFYTSCFSELKINLFCIISAINETLFLVY